MQVPRQIDGVTRMNCAAPRVRHMRTALLGPSLFQPRSSTQRDLRDRKASRAGVDTERGLPCRVCLKLIWLAAMTPFGVSAKFKADGNSKFSRKFCSMIARCSLCGSSQFRHGRVLWRGLIDEWQLSPSEVAYVDRQQGTSCQGCGAQLRAIALTQAVQSHLHTTMPLKGIVADRRYQGIRMLDLNGCAAFSDMVAALPGYVRADYPAVDMTAMPYHDSSFDIVVHSDTLEHIPDPVKALRECLRVVNNCGAVCFTVPLIVGRLTRSRDGLPKSYHGDSMNNADDYVVHSEFGADIWSYALRAGAHSVSICSAEFPAAQAITLQKSPVYEPIPGRPVDAGWFEPIHRITLPSSAVVARLWSTVAARLKRGTLP